MQPIPFYKKLLSYIVPVRIEKTRGTENPYLELLYYRGQYQLATKDALYSDGDRYRPLNIAFTKINNVLGDVKSVLVLGTGIGSAVTILNKKGYQPAFTLVEYDATVLKIAVKHLGDFAERITPVCANAENFMNANKEQYDIVVVDVFNSRVVPEFVTTKKFLEQCRSAMHTQGYVILNYIVQEEEEWRKADTTIREVFPNSVCVDDGLNRIIIATV